MINGKTSVLCLIGNPTRHSLSPIIHNASLTHLNLNYVYVSFEVEPNYLRASIEGLRALGIRGANVTMPYKTEVIKYLDKISKLANETGAVNTILNEKGKLIGYNTDGIGALKALERFTDVNDKKVVLLGAGGAARAIATILSGKVSELVILNRTRQKADQLAQKLKEKDVNVKALQLSDRNLRTEVGNSNILINATSVGMNSNISLVSKEILKQGLVVFDLVYTPLETKLLRDAKAKQCITIDGLWMLIYQGAESLKIWTGHYPSIELMREAAIKMVNSNDW